VPSGLTGDIGSQLGSDSSLILSARRGLASMAAVLPDEAQRTATLGTDLLIAESSELSDAQRHSLLTRVEGAITRVGNLITLPRSSSITLTSTRGQIPLTVLMAPAMHARVQLRLSSERLIFQSFSPSNGTCQEPTPTSEVCDLTLTAQNTTLKVPVETRSSGVFPVDVSLWAPGGVQLIAHDRDTVRSTAVSGVGVILIVVAILSLAVWWARDLRHGRRARQLVPPAEEESESDSGASSADSHAAANPADGDNDGNGQSPDGLTDEERFFAKPAPEYHSRAAEPQA
jgi:hypothetical protein